MSPVHSPSAPSFRIRRRHVSPTTVGLFPECPDVISPKQVVQGLAPVADQRGNISDHATPDCPPASRTPSGNQNREMGPVRNVATAPPERAHARLVGIARLAAFSPPAETRRKSAEKPEYFVLPVKSILNRCDSNRVPFEWTINPYRGAVKPRNRHNDHDVARRIDPAARAAGAPAGFAAGGSEAIVRSRAGGRRIGFTADPWNYGPRGRLGSGSRGGEGG